MTRMNDENPCNNDIQTYWIALKSTETKQKLAEKNVQLLLCYVDEIYKNFLSWDGEMCNITLWWRWGGLIKRWMTVNRINSSPSFLISLLPNSRRHRTPPFDSVQEGTLILHLTQRFSHLFNVFFYILYPSLPGSTSRFYAFRLP